MSRLDIDNDKDLIIPRALMATTSTTFEQDIEKLESLYSQTTITEELRSTAERISNSVCEMIAKRYHVKQFSRFGK